MRYKTNSIILNAIQWDCSEHALIQLKLMAFPNIQRLKYSAVNMKGIVEYPSVQITEDGTIQTVNRTDWIVAGDGGALFVMPDNLFKILASKAE